MSDSLAVLSLRAVAAELYGLDPREFTAARTARVKDLRSIDAVLAQQVGALRKPSPAAWIVNLLARERAERMRGLMALGASMRLAQAALDRGELGRLSTQRRDEVRELIAEGASLATAAGAKPSAAVLNEVEQCLQAGTVDADAAAAVTSGRLVRALSATGFEEVDLADAVAAPDVGTRAAASTSPRPPVDIAVARRRAEARKQAERLDREAGSAAAELEKVIKRGIRLEERRDALNEEIANLEQRLEATETQLTTLERESRELAAEQKRAREAAEEADRLAVEARAALE
ncbi:transposase [Glaciihabitans tibetensis]|nr:transposase [Glaciihabitans tibetensis]